MLKRFAATLIALVAFTTLGLAADNYVVRKGNNLIWIAGQHNVGWQAMLLANEQYLQTKYEKVCGKLSDAFRHRTTNKGALKGGKYYCNDGMRRSYGNTLQPGWTLAIPTSISPASVERTVSEIKGERIAVVIDNTGSMDNKRRETANFYLATLKKFGKKLTGVWLFADGSVDKYEAGDVVRLTSALNKPFGGDENTLDGMTKAAASKPDAIILVTDEKGDDWGNWNGVKSLPPVIAHCLPLPPNSRHLVGCEQTLSRLASETGGKYIFGLSEPTASR